MRRHKKPKRRIYHVAFGWHETYDAPMRFVEIIKHLGWIVYDIAPKGVDYLDYVIADKPVKKYKGKEL